MGGMRGFGKGLVGTAFRPMKGLYLSGAAAGQAVGLKSPHQVYLIQRRSPVKPPRPASADVERRCCLPAPVNPSELIVNPSFYT